MSAVAVRALIRVRDAMERLDNSTWGDVIGVIALAVIFLSSIFIPYGFFG